MDKYIINYTTLNKKGGVMYLTPTNKPLALNEEQENDNREFYNELENNTKELILYFQTNIINNYFTFKPEGSFICVEDNNYYNIEWVLNDTIYYNSIVEQDIYFDKTCSAIEKICDISSATDYHNQSIPTGPVMIGHRPQQTHIHVSYKNTVITNDTYHPILKSLSLNWVNKYQNIFKNRFINDYESWASESKQACGKPLIFSKVVAREGKNYIKILEKLIPFRIETNEHGNFFYFDTSLELLGISFRSTQMWKYGDYYTNVPWFESLEELTNEDNDFYQNRYIDLNFQPMVISRDRIELHVEFRALNNFVNVGGGVNTFITENFVSINNFLNEFANCVNEYFTEALLGISPENLRFGIEIETCTKISDIKVKYPPLAKRRRA